MGGILTLELVPTGVLIRYVTTMVSWNLELTSFPGILDQLHNLDAGSRNDMAIKVTLPPSWALDQILGKSWEHTTQRTTYRIGLASQALRQASSLVKVLAYPLTSHDPAFCSIISWSENGPWLLDTMLDMSMEQKRWNDIHTISPASTVELILDIIDGAAGNADPAIFTKSKGLTLLVLSCAEWASGPGDLILDDETGNSARLIFCKALAMLAQASMLHAFIARLVDSKLLRELSFLSSQFSILGDGTDTWVSCQV